MKSTWGLKDMENNGLFEVEEQSAILVKTGGARKKTPIVMRNIARNNERVHIDVVQNQQIDGEKFY